MSPGVGDPASLSVAEMLIPSMLSQGSRNTRLAMSIVIAAIYGLASLCLSMRMRIATGLTYGVCVFVVMTYVVVPLSAAPSRYCWNLSDIAVFPYVMPKA
jgi:uncharacterized membrane protein YagU involved in acid resistance